MKKSWNEKSVLVSFSNSYLKYQKFIPKKFMVDAGLLAQSVLCQSDPNSGYCTHSSAYGKKE